MDDLLFLKRLDTKRWLGLRMPPDLEIVAGTGNKALPEKPWTLDAPPVLEWTDAVYYGPAAVKQGEVISLTWKKREPNDPFTGLAFADVLADVETLPVSDAEKENVRNQLSDARVNAGVSLPLRAYHAYLKTQGGSKPSLEAWRNVVLAAFSERPGELPVEAFGGLLFLVEADAAPVPKEGVFVDPADPSMAKLEELRVKAFQHSRGVSFECADAVDGISYTNSSVLDAVDGKTVDGKTYSGYYRITRTLGVVERPSRRSALVAIPTGLVDADGRKNPVVGLPTKEQWAQRRFRLADSLAPDELIGELLNYRIEFFNPHGRMVRVGRVMLQRQRLDPPAALTRAIARLVTKPDGNDATLSIRFDLPPTEKPDGAGLELVLYCLKNPALPTGFYGDADDAAVQVARLLSDIDPAAVMDVRAGDQVLSGASSERAQTNLSNHGLEPFATIPQEKFLELPKSKPAEEDSWSQCRWEVGVEDLGGLVPSRQAVRLMLALRRVVAPNSTGAVFDGPVPESPVLEPQMLIGFEATSTERDQVVPHFEKFWTPPLAFEPLDPDRVFFSEVDTPSERAQPKEADNRALVRMQVQHLVPNAAPDAEPVGGYRVWMRDLPARHAPGYPFEALAVVQAVPQLVKAYAPIEMGRQWWVQVASGDPGAPNAEPEKTFLVSSSPHAMIRGREDDRTPEQIAAQPPDALFDDVTGQLNTLLTEIRNGEASMHDVRGGALLLKFWRMLDQSLCKEVLLNISQRRELTRDGAQKWLANRQGNWILFCDQNGGYLGRAWTFKGPQADKVKRIHVLNEVPNTEDTVAIDDFGQLTWNWAGLQDAWHHELEWVVEPLSRYAPLRRRALPLAERPADKPRHPMPSWQVGTSDAGIPEAKIHRLAVLRRMPFEGRVGLVPLPDAEEDAFVWQVNLPPEFRRATHNTHARTALGALRLEVIDAIAEPLLADDFEPAADVDPLIEAWCSKPQPDNHPVPETLESIDEGHQLVIHQPACFKVMLKVRPRADTKSGEVTFLEQWAERVPKTFSNKLMIRSDHCYIHEQGTELVVPVARLGWSYTGESRPTVKDVIGRTGNPLIATMPGLRLPDPAASLTVFIKQGDGVLRPCTYFFGPAFPRDDTLPQTGWKKQETTNVAWGVAYRDPSVVAGITLFNGGLHRGDLVLTLKPAYDASQLRVLWKRGGVASDLMPDDPA